MWTEPTLEQWAQVADGQLLGDDLKVGRLSTDSRTVTTDDIYVALKGELFDGHNYLPTALQKGAQAIVVSRFQDECDVPQLLVPDTRKALGYLAGLLRDRFDGQVVALTGSAGKTSTRAMLQSIFEQQPGLLATEGNFNNDIGVPKTWFRLNESHQRVLLEMGANAPGEIAWMGAFSRPHISLLLNASEAHSLGFGGIEGVRQAKGEILTATAKEGGCVLNRDDPAFEYWLQQAGDRRVITFGKSGRADVSLLSFEASGNGSRFNMSLPDGELSVEWAMLGKHMALNAAAAAATAWLAGVSALDIAEGLSRVEPQSGRMQPLPSEHGGVLIHDAYNASPAAVRSAIEVLAEQSDDTLLILGDMLELGRDSERLHRDIGSFGKGRISELWSLGKDSRLASDQCGGRHFEHLDILLAELPARLTNNTAVLIKGSRSIGMERVVEALRRKP